MASYVLRRFLISIPLLLAISLVTFLFMQLAPGDMLAAYKQDPQMPREIIDKLEEEFHLNDPVLVQYGYWLGNLLRGNLGIAFTHQRPVLDVIKSRLLNTIILSLASMLLAWLVALPIGIYAAVHQYSWSDKLFSFLAFFGMSIPSFFFCLLLLYLASITGILPPGGMTSPNFDDLSVPVKIWDVLKHLVIPSVVIATGAMAGLQRLMRGNLLEVLRAQYITTARAKGLPENRVIYRHAVRNAINPMVTIFGYQLSGLLGGAALVEMVVGWPGLGMLMLTAVRAQDKYLVMGDLLIAGMLLIVGNLIADILLAYVDPRISYG